MELRTKSKRPGIKSTIDVFYDKTIGFSKYINDSATYKMVLVKSGSFVVEENGEYKVITAPVGMAVNEKADFKVISESGVESSTIYFKPSFIREEFTFEAINSGKYDKLLNAVKKSRQMDPDERMITAIEGNVEFEDSYDASIYQDAILLLEFNWHERDIVYYTLTKQEYDAVNRMFESVKYDLVEQPDNLWILRVRYFIITLLFTATADFYRNFRQDEIYKDPLVAKVARYLWENLGDDITLTGILRKFSVNKNTLNEAFNNEMSMSCMAYLEQLRVNLAKKMLQFSDYSISEISSTCGYKDVSYFSKVFKKHTGQTASEYQKYMKDLR